MRKELFLAASGALFFWGCASYTIEGEAISFESGAKAANLSHESVFIAALDKQYQAIFADLELTKEKMVPVRRTDGKEVMVKRTARVGGARMWSAPPSHANLVMPKGHHEELRKLVDQGWHYSVSLYGNDGKPLSSGPIKVSAVSGGNAYPKETDHTSADFRLAVSKFPKSPTSEESLNFAREYVAGGSGKTTIDGWTLEARAVRLSKRECLNCHTESKLNDPIGILVYGVRPFKTSK